MDNKYKGITWAGNIYQKFEDMCLGMDDVLFQEFEYVGDKLQVMGSNVRQFCSDFAQVLPQSFVDVVQGAAADSSTNVASELLVEGIGEERSRKKPFNKIDLLNNRSKEHFQVLQDDPYLEEAALMFENELVTLDEDHSDESPCELNKSDKNSNDQYQKTMMSPASDDLPPCSSSFTKIKLLDGPSTNAADLVYCYEFEQTCGNSSAQIVRKLESNLTDAGLSTKAKVEESCILVDGSEVSYGVCETQRRISLKVVEAFFRKRRGAAKQDHHQGAACRYTPDPAFSPQKGKDFISSSKPEASEFDWEII
ncbi:hypothetical protein K2173_001577 [Erythroxylum novogranatense]|uniref:Uncharacterized protein n=1 Tax=Erythroxylum novogranatense TaxID=1862640 RepID=A0AAV8T5E8_9ROSI|nr:hypothetical protein K2173_001577 [Erythroxylum novogranatense]